MKKRIHNWILFYFMLMALCGQYATHFEHPMHFSLSITILPENSPSFTNWIAPVGQTLFAPQNGDLSQFLSIKIAFFTLSLLY